MHTTMDLSARAENQTAKPGGSNYFFGFLIAFITLISLFVGCGLGQRRWRRRLMAGAGMNEWGFTYDEQAQAAVLANKLPKFWEPWTDTTADASSGWKTLLPLSACHTRAHRPTMPRITSRTTALPSPNPQALNGLSLPRWIEQESTPQPPSPPPTVTGLEIAFLIAMPRPSAAAEKAEQDGQLGEYEIGSLHVPWSSEITS